MGAQQCTEAVPGHPIFTTVRIKETRLKHFSWTGGALSVIPSSLTGKKRVAEKVNLFFGTLLFFFFFNMCLSIAHQNETFVIADEPILTRHTPQSPQYTAVQFWW